MDFEKILETDTLNQGRVKINNNGEAVKGQISQLSESITDNFEKTPHIYISEYWNLIDAKQYEKVLEKTFVNNGIETANIGYYTYVLIPCKPNTLYRLHDSEYASGQARFVNFYDSEKNFISPTNSEKFNVTTPNNCYYMTITFKYKTNTFEKGTVYVTDHDPTNFVDEKSVFVPDGFILPRSAVQAEANKDIIKFAEHRRAVINFQFDDGHVKDANIAQIFRAKNKVCGFALIYNNNRINEYLSYQNEGFEILSHSTDGTAMSDTSQSISTIEEKMRASKAVLSSYGFDIRGWVTPSSKLNDIYIPSLRKYYDYGATLYWDDLKLATYTQDKNTDTCKIWRISLQGKTLEQQKQAVDEAVSNGHFLTFYGHSADLDGSSYLTTSNLNSLLDYIQTKIDRSECYLLKPSDAVDYYFHVRHCDYLELLNR